jgi:hypothetical protein
VHEGFLLSTYNTLYAVLLDHVASCSSDSLNFSLKTRSHFEPSTGDLKFKTAIRFKHWRGSVDRAALRHAVQSAPLSSTAHQPPAVRLRHELKKSFQLSPNLNWVIPSGNLTQLLNMAIEIVDLPI